MLYYKTKHRFTHTYEDSSQPKSKVIVETESESLPDIIRHFEEYLRGCGFTFDGYIDIIDTDEEENGRKS